MSGGELQRVRLARALVQEPEILIFDEPSTHLDILNRKVIFSLMEKMRSENKIIIFSSNEPNEALEYSDYTLIIGKNRKYIFGRTKSILTPEVIKTFFNVESELTQFQEKDIIFYL